MNKRMTMAYAVAAGVAATVLLAGCNGGDEDPTTTPTPTGSSTGSPTPSGSTSTTTSPSPSVSASLPSAARANTEAGAMAFANFYVTELNRADVSGDTRTIRSLAKPTCSFCLDLAKLIDEEATKGNHMDRLSFEIAGSQAASFTTNAATVGVLVNDGPAQRVSKDGAVLGKKPAQKLSYSVTLSWGSGAWTVQELELL